MNDLVKKYVEWLHRKITIRQIDDWFEITTPFLNHHNDHIQLFAKYENGKILLSDGGNTLTELEMSGVNILRSEKRRSELDVILNGFGIKKNDKEELFAFATESNFPEVKHRLLQSIISIDDLFVIAQPKIESFFMEDVRKFFDAHDVPYIARVSFVGRSNFTHHFDFSIPRSKKNPERIIRAVNTPRKDTVTTMLFAFEDTKLVRPESQGIAILNDETNSIQDDVLSALDEYKIRWIKWSMRESLIDAFAA